MRDRRALARGVLGVTGAGLAAVVLGAGGSVGRLAGILAGVVAAAAGVCGWSAATAADRQASARLAQAGDRESALRNELDAAERTVSELTSDAFLSPRRPKEGEVLIDPITGLYSESYLLVALEARIAAARRRLRPISVVMIEVVQGVASGRPVAADPLPVAVAVRATLREADTASRTSEGRFVLVLEDTPENGAIWSVERLRARLTGEHPDHTLWAGIACYPAHAFNLDEILLQAGNALEAAKEWRQDRIEVATGA